jgi:hypothetical protein
MREAAGPEGGWRKLRNALFRDLYPSPDRTVGGTCGTHGKEDTFVQLWCERLKHTAWKLQMRKQLHMADDGEKWQAVVNAVMNIRVP